jgi:hypothetical protein
LSVQPLPTPAPLQGDALLDFVQGWIAGVLGSAVIDSSLVRPYAQAVPPVVPTEGTAWIAFTVAVDESDTFTYQKQIDDATVEFQRQERMRVLCSFYDTGVASDAGMLADLLRDGITIPQNLEPLYLANFGLVGTEQQTSISVMEPQTRWTWRVDMPIILTRQVTRNYGQTSIASANGTLKTDVGLPDVPINA